MGNLFCGCVSPIRKRGGIKDRHSKGFEAYGLTCDRRPSKQEPSYIRRTHLDEDMLEESSQPPGRWLTYHYNFQNLVLSGGGTKGYSYIGALKVRYLFHRDQAFIYVLITVMTTNSLY